MYLALADACTLIISEEDSYFKKEEKIMKSVRKRLMIQFILIQLIWTLRELEPKQYKNAIKQLQQSRLPTFLIENIIKTVNREDVIT